MAKTTKKKVPTKKSKSERKVIVDGNEYSYKVKSKKVPVINGAISADMEKLVNQINKLDNSMRSADDKIFNIMEKNLPEKAKKDIEKLNRKMEKDARERERLEAKINKICQFVLGKMLKGAISEDFKLNSKDLPAGVSYKNMSCELLAMLLGVEENTKEFNSTFEELRAKHSKRYKRIHTLLFRNDDWDYEEINTIEKKD